MYCSKKLSHFSQVPFHLFSFFPLSFVLEFWCGIVCYFAFISFHFLLHYFHHQHFISYTLHLHHHTTLLPCYYSAMLIELSRFSCPLDMCVPNTCLLSIEKRSVPRFKKGLPKRHSNIDIQLWLMFSFLTQELVQCNVQCAHSVKKKGSEWG